MRTFLTTTALVTALALPVAAQDMQPAEGPFAQELASDALHASDFIGSRVHTTESNIDNVSDTQFSDDWSDVGEIREVVMTRDGAVEAVLVDVGGFLGIGEKTVAVRMDDLKFVSDADNADEVHIVFTSTREQLENAPQIEMAEDATTAVHGQSRDAVTGGDSSADMAAAEHAAAGDAETAAQATSEEMSEDGQPGGNTAASEMAEGGFTAPAIEREGYSPAKADILTTEHLTGSRVYDTNDEWIGDVAELMIDDQGKITDAVIDVGGFLGLGEKPVAVSFDALTVAQEDNGDEVRVYLDATEDELTQMPRYEH